MSYDQSGTFHTNITQTIHVRQICLQCFDAVGWAAEKTEWWSTGMVICLERDADLHMAQLMPLSLSKNQIGFTFLVLAYPGSPGKRAVKRVCVSTSDKQ